MGDILFIALLGSAVGYCVVKHAIKQAVIVIFVGCIIYLALTQPIEGAEPIIDQLRSIL